MPEKIAAPYGSWKSPISTDLIVADSVRLGQPRIAGKEIWWTEGRPKQEGRCFLVRADKGNIADMTDAAFNVRTRANEYGGGDFLVAGGMLYFSNNEDQRLYHCVPGKLPQPLTHRESMRYADAILDAGRQRLIAVREDHSEGGHEPVNTLVAISLADGSETILHAGHDFYSSPRLAPSGRHLAWLCWDHPNMPWDGTALWQAEIGPEGGLLPPALVAGGTEESIYQPEYSKRGVLHFVSDRSGWWNLYRAQAGAVEALCPMHAEFGEAQWIFGMSMYGFDARDRLVCTYIQHGRSQLAILDQDNGRLHPFGVPFDAITDLQVGDGFAVFCGGSPRASKSIVALDLITGMVSVLRSANGLHVAAEDLALPEALEFPTEGGLTAHAFFYRPANAQHTGPEGAKPPLLVFTHGGPTAMTTATLNLAIQYWTSRGFAVVDVNYGGSSGYGRAYRQRLNGSWGVVDVDDAVNAARHLAHLGEIDAERMAIRGSSAGGYTTLSALTFRDVFKAGASYYGIGDLETLVADTHKFEARYLDKLVGPYPETKARYVERSPIHFTDRLSSPLILFQGMKDKVVPPSQAETMFNAVKAKGLPVACIYFEQEGHGFRQAANIKRALDAELYFYSRVFGFEPATRIEPVLIENLPA